MVAAVGRVKDLVWEQVREAEYYPSHQEWEATVQEVAVVAMA